jgi:subtilisin family serine protease
MRDASRYEVWAIHQLKKRTGMRKSNAGLLSVILSAGLAIATAVAAPADKSKWMAVGAPEKPSTQVYALKLRSKTQTTQALEADLAQASPGVKLRWRSKFWPDIAVVEGPADLGSTFSRLPSVQKVQIQQQTKHAAVVAQGTKLLPRVALAVKTAEIPLSVDPQAGKGIKIGILSTGIDYTHAAFGGAGTAAAYADALANETAPYDGFPTAVVIGGLDLASEATNLLEDHNPIDSNMQFSEPGYTFPTGRGTYLASIVHRLAPGAKLVALKAYGIWQDHGRTFVKDPGLDTFGRAFEAALDPNNDGDTSKHVDVLLLDDSSGSLAFYDPGRNDPTSASLLEDMVQDLTAHGVVVICTSGDLIADAPYSIAETGAVPDAVTVGGLDGNTIAAFSGRGPVRGTARYLKPELVSDATQISGATVGSGGTSELRDTTDAAAARIAAAVAILKAQRPTLSVIEIKAALVNTANHQIYQDALHAQQPADISRAGLGRENLDAAARTQVTLWDDDTNQPSLFVGFHEVTGSERYVRQLRVRNLSGNDQTFTMSTQKVGDKPGFAALTVESPATVHVPAHGSTLVPVVFTVDATKLPAWTMREKGQFSDDGWSQAELSGYLVLSQQGQPDVAMSWMLMARPRTQIAKLSATYADTFNSAFWQGYLGVAATLEQRQDFRNDNPSAVRFATYPVIVRVDAPKASHDGYGSDQIHYVGGGVFDEPRCSSGKKLSVAMILFQSTPLASPNQFDTLIGPAVFRWGLFPDPLGSSADAFVAIGEVALDVQGQPSTYYLNPAVAADPTQPTTLMLSKLPARMASHTRNIVSEVCLDELYHDSFNSLAAFNANLRWDFLTDGDEVPGGFTPLTYNPVQGGYAALLKQPGQADSAFVPEADANAGVSLNLGAAMLDSAQFFSADSGPLSTGPQGVADGFLLLSLTDDFVLFSRVGTTEGNEVSSPRAGQVFQVREDAAAGTVVGHIETDIEQFFGIGLADPAYALTLTNALPGDPLAVQPNGDIVVTNAAGLNHRLDPILVLNVLGTVPNGGLLPSAIVAVTVQVTSAHNTAPVYSGDKSLPDAATLTPYQFVLGSAFSDPDGNPLSYSAQGLPNGLSLDSTGGTISGTPVQSGDFKVTVTANDGFQSTSVPLQLTVRSTDAPAGGGGALSPLGLLLLGLGVLLRLARRSGKRWWLPLLAAVSLSAHAAHVGEEPAKPLPRNANAARQAVPEVLRDNQGRNLYFLQFQDAPLARYDGEVKGLPATSLHATARRNVTRSGTLDVQSASSQSYLSYLQNQQSSALQAVAGRLGYAVAPKERFSIALNAVTAYLSPAEAQNLAGLPQLRSVRRILPSKLLTDRGPNWINAPQVWSGVGGSAGSQGEGVIVGIIDTGITPSAPSFAAVGGDGYHHQNPLGSGVYLGDCVAKPQLCNDKLIGIVSYPDITFYYQGQRPADGVDHDGHGTHTASTVAGNVLKNVTIYNGIGQATAETFPQISGVAPHANIIAYQVCYPGTTGERSGCLPNLTALAVEDAIQHGVRVLNYSIGGTATDPWSAESMDGQAFLSARAAGIHVAVAAGNDGPAAETVSSPGNAPWVTTAAASSHDRAYTAKTLGGFSGGTAPPATINGKGVTSGYTGTVVSAADHGDALCLNPFASGTFSGQIVVCQRGQNARVAKGANALAGGAGGMILINVDDAANDVVEDYHALPAIHIDKADGAAIMQWLSSSSGSTPTATISNSVLAPSAAAADIVADFSSRGPSYPYADWIKPDLAAPGVNIYAAYSPDQLFQNPSYPAPYAFLSGTSMATPHTAGTLALIAAVHPDWTPAEAQSALVMTARPVLRTASGASAGLFDGGNGRIDAAAAAQAGLVLNETAANYMAAAPRNGSSTPGPLNLPSLVSANCVLQCTWTRTVRATRSGSYSAGGTVSDSGAAIAVSPPNFSLAPGQTQQLTISLKAVGQTSNVAVSGIVALTPADSTSPTLRLPMTARLSTSSVPALTHIEASANQGTQLIDGLASSASNVQYGLNGWTIAQRYPAKLIPDPRFGQTGNQQVVPLAVTASTRLLVVRTLDGTAADLDLYIALDKLADGKFDSGDSDYLCTGIGPGTDKQCVLVNPKPGSYVIVVHDVQGQASGDTHTLVVAQVKNTVNGLRMNGPTAVAPGQPFAANIGWNLPTLQSDDLAYALFSVEQTNGTPDIGPFGIVELHRVIDPLSVTADASDILSGTNITYTLHLAAATAATTVDVDLPAALSLVSAEGNPDIGSNHLSWNLASGNGTTLKLVVGTAGLTQTQNVALAFAYRQGSSAGANASAPPVTVEGYPVARIAGAAAATLKAKAGDTLSLDTSGSTGALDSDTLQFSWRQVAGPGAPVIAANGGFSLHVPGAAAGRTLRYELIVSNGRRSSVPATLEIDVASNSSGGGGGAMGWPLLIAMLMALMARRVVKPVKAR